MKVNKTSKIVLVNKIDNGPKPKSQNVISKSTIKKLQNQKPNIKLFDLVYGKKFCVVGNSPKELGSGNGKIIDSYDIVIRFKNYITDEFAKDYGTKTDVWITPFNLTQFYRDPAQYKSVCCCLPLTHPRWQKRFPTTNINYELMAKYDSIEFVPLKTFQQIWDKYEKGQPSSGMTTLYWLYKLVGKLNKKDLFGFSIFDPKESHHYFSHKESHKLSTEWSKNTPYVHPRKIETRVFNEITV